MNKYAPKMAELDTWFKRPDLEALYRRKSLSLSEPELLKLEDEIGYPLPTDYREFLAEFGGTILFDSPEFPLADPNGRTGEVDRFWAGDREIVEMYKNTCESDWLLDEFGAPTLLGPVKEFEELDYDDEDLIWVKWPKKLLPIASSGGNGKTCLVVSGERVGAVFYWLNRPVMDLPMLYFVAASFDEFMCMLKIP